ncbi:hypothetical protein [Anaeromyxobacter oryzae]|uniref:Uncharacterized protein n=1 Tax=Anaeromyxobacter oryzae TaxID=2918170 RepID=A0ABM7WR14_9BACT|nr:hypothetical protein [Anaeromyxobacter oryzae]BDG01915.1 hypothetical protein AMOR_09110 [Anaeromyxobacter oryzae]
MKRIIRAVVAVLVGVALCFASVARAEEVYVRQGSAAGTIARDAVGGTVLGSAVAGGIILYQTQINDRSNYDWQRTLGYGALIGLGVGLVWGVVDATTGPAYGMATPVHDGNSMSLDLRRVDQSNEALFPVALGRF